MTKKETKTSRKAILAIIFGILIMVIAQIGAGLIGGVLYAFKATEFIGNIIAGLLYILFSYLLIKLLCEKFLKSSLKEYYIDKFKIDYKWLLVGILLPVIVSGIYFFLPGSLEKASFGTLTKLSIITSSIFFTSLGAGVVEEMIFRGVIMNSLKKEYNRVIAIIVPSLIFGILHILGMKFSVLSCILVIIAGTAVGIMFSLIAENEHSIWSGAFVHAFWNLISCSGLLHIGNEVAENTLFNYLLKNKSFALTGGEFGIESSVIAVVGYILVCIFAYFLLKKKESK